MAMLNIPSYKTDDPNYRYKMPRLVAKVEGRGNGIKTNIVNMGDIARALKRPPDYPTKFCGTELGAQSKFDPAEGKAIVNGAHEQRDLQLLIDKFIEKFVLCEQCRLPEIDLVIKKGRVQYHCNACGQKGEVDNAHKLSTFILKNPPGGADSTMGTKKKSAAERREEKAQKAAARAKEQIVAPMEESDVDDESTEKDKKKKKKSKKDDAKDAEGKSSKSQKSSKTKENGGDKKGATAAANGGDTVLGNGAESASTDESDMAKMSSAADQDGKRKKKSSKKNRDGCCIESLDALDNLNYASQETKDVIERLLDFLTISEKTGDKTTLQLNPEISPSMFYDQLRVLQMAQGIDHALKFFIALEVLFASELRGMRASTLQQRLKYLKPVVLYTAASDVLTALQDFVYLRAGTDVVPEGFEGFSGILYSFYNDDLLSAEGIQEFYSEKAMKKWSNSRHGRAKEAMAAGSKAAQPFLEWLDESSDEDDDDDEVLENNNVDASYRSAKSASNSQSQLEEQQSSVKALGTVEKRNGVAALVAAAATGDSLNHETDHPEFPSGILGAVAGESNDSDSGSDIDVMAL